VWNRFAYTNVKLLGGWDNHGIVNHGIVKTRSQKYNLPMQASAVPPLI